MNTMKTLLIATILVIFNSFMSMSQKQHWTESTIGKTYELNSIEIAQFDLPDEITWYDAKWLCGKLGKGWRLPTKGELEDIYNNRDLIGNFSGINYWSSSSFSYDYAWMEVFEYELIAISLKEGHLNARAVRTIK